MRIFRGRRVEIRWRQMTVFLGAIAIALISVTAAALGFELAGWLLLPAAIVIAYYWWSAFDLFTIYERSEDEA